MNYTFRMHDPRVGRFFAADPLTKEYPHYTPYSFSGNKPIQFRELEGLEESPAYLGKDYFSTNPSSWYRDDALIMGYTKSPKQGMYGQNTFWKASIFNTNKLNFALYKTIQERHNYYEFAHQYARQSVNSLNTKWYKAAAIVTGEFAVGAAESINLWFLTDDAENFLKQGNKYLFRYNMENFQGIMNGKLEKSFVNAEGKSITLKGKNGKELDYALVEYEQTKVQDFINNFAKNNSNLDEIVKVVNGAFDAPLAPSTVKKVLKENFTDKEGNSTFNFSKYSDRVKLGQKIIDILYNENN